MKTSKFSEAQKAFILKQGRWRAVGRSLQAGWHQPGDVLQTGRGSMKGVTPPEMRRLKQLESAKLKRIVADLSLDKELLQDVIRRKL